MIFGRKKRDSLSAADKKAGSSPSFSMGNSLLDEAKKKKNNSFSNFQNPEILRLDLIKEESEGRINWRHYFNLTIVALLMSAFIVAQCYYIISWWQDNSTSSESIARNTEQAKAAAQKLQSSADEAMLFSKRVDLIVPLLNHHIYWTKFFSYLEQNTLSTVTFAGGFSGDTSGNYSLGAKANHYSDINWQVKKFLADDSTLSATVGSGSSGGQKTASDASSTASSTQDQVSEAQRQAAAQKLKAAGPQSVSFSISLKVDPKIFYSSQ